MFQMSGVGPMQGQAGFFLNASEKIPFAINRYVTETKRLYSVLETQLADHKYLVDDDEPSIADFSTFTWVRLSPRLGIHLAEEFPNIHKWITLLDARPGAKAGFAALLPPFNPDITSPASFPSIVTKYNPEVTHPAALVAAPASSVSSSSSSSSSSSTSSSTSPAEPAKH